LKYPHLFQPITLRGLTLKNRIFSAPTSLAELGPDEHYSRANIEYYKLRAVGGAALVTVGDVIVDLDTGRSHPQQTSLNDPSAIPYFVELVDAIRSGGAAASVELDHGGALCPPEFIGGKNAIGPSGYVDEWGDTVEKMTEEQIYSIADAFAQAAANAKDCGFDMVMIHAGHGWLIHQFLSPITNHRTDKWGGSLENRLRFPLLVVDKVREAVGPNFPIEIRISGSERMEGGYDLDTGIEIAKALDGRVDLIHVSAGTQQDLYSAILMHPGAFQRDMENAYLAAEIKKHVKTPVVAVGAFNLPDQMERFIAAGHADCIALGRALLADPFLPRKALAGRDEEITPCLRCGECHSGMIKTRNIRCTVNPIIGREHDFFHPVPVRRHKKVLVAGGGPGGIQAALTAQERGHKVVLCEAGPSLGGALKFADSGADFKIPMLRYRESQIKKLLSSGVELRLNTQVDEALVEEIKPDVLIAAVGAVPFIIPVPGSDGPNVIAGADLTKDTPVGERIVIIGGGLVGCEEAVHYARLGHQITIIEMLPELAMECGKMHRINLLHQIDSLKNISYYTGMKCRFISLEGVAATDSDGNERFLPADTVIMATGMRPRSDQVEALRPLVDEFYVIGDAARPRNVMHAVREGYDAAVNLGLY
jgi:2,4-dienoyl-CoA reductase-like NADH-dependent reductase (Old Yellow Enzyme family)/NADPH-dependent 2,4-dienoyl-CoA reductase/sulfur reductase-like enzyme